MPLFSPETYTHYQTSGSVFLTFSLSVQGVSCHTSSYFHLKLYAHYQTSGSVP